MSNVVADQQVVVIHYTLTDADTGETIEKTGTEGLVYLHGAGTLLPAFEAQLAGKAEGAPFTITLPPADGYGERKGPGPQAIKRSELRKDAYIAPGMRFKAKGSNGQEVALWVVKVAGSRVWVDTEHPLVGKALTWNGTVTKVRPATDEERAHGHAHGVDGHAHAH
jgi:FKBP-type peptidyl-prolyl cis-trans isomerase SlyD